MSWNVSTLGPGATSGTEDLTTIIGRTYVPRASVSSVFPVLRPKSMIASLLYAAALTFVTSAALTIDRKGQN